MASAIYASLQRAETGEAQIEAAMAPSQYGHAAIAEIIESWTKRGASQRARRIRYECARAALRQTGESFAQIAARIQCTRAAISKGVIVFYDHHGTPHDQRVGRGEDTRLKNRQARLRVHAGIMQPAQPRTLAPLERLKCASRAWIARECGVSERAVWGWFSSASNPNYRRPSIAVVQTLARLANRELVRAKTGRPLEKHLHRNSYTSQACQKNFQKK